MEREYNNAVAILIKLGLILFILVNVYYYYRKTVMYRETEVGQKVLALASQITMSAFIFGLAVILIQLNMIGLGKKHFVNALLYYGVFVSLVNVVAIWYYEKTVTQKNDGE